MESLWEKVLAVIVIAIFLVPIILALILATLVAHLFSALFKPITDPIHGMIGDMTTFNPLDMIPLSPTIKHYFGSAKNILFICFVLVFLVFHFQSLSNVDLILDNISLLFPGSALEQVTTFEISDETLDISSFFVNPESYLQTIIFSFITGLFMHIGCTTKDPDAKIHILVKLLYTLLISLFSAIVLGKIPPDMFNFSFPEISLDYTSAGAVAGGSEAMMLLAQLQEWGGFLLKSLVSLIPTIVAIYFLSNSISGFAASYLGGFIALCSVAIGWPDAFLDPYSFQSVFILLLVLVIGEVIALSFGELINKVVEMSLSESSRLFAYYNIVTLLISYFFYPTLVLSILGFISLYVNGFDFAVLLLSLASLLVFSLSTFAEYKIARWTSGNGSSVSGVSFVAAMVFNIPIWIIYIIIYIV